jgi:phosphatidylglycerophosphate synthase
MLRGFLAFSFLLPQVTLRLVAISLALVTDVVDGYVARRYKSTSRLGAVLDPAMDKFFVMFALVVFLLEGRLSGWQGAAMLTRDLSLCIFGVYLSLSGHWQSYEFRAIRWGKVTTSLQFIVLMGLSLGFQIPGYVYLLFVFFGAMAFTELLQVRKPSPPPTV